MGSVAVLQGTSPWNISSVYGNISGSVMVQNITPSSMLTGASIFGQLPAGAALLGSVIARLYDAAGSGLTTTSNALDVNLKSQAGTQIRSVIGSIPSSLLTGVHGHRNDAIASFLGGNLSWRPIATDSAGRPVTKPFAPEESRIEGYNSVVSTSVTTLVAAAGAGLRNYITDVWLANTGSVATLVTFRSGGGTSVLGYTIAPSGSGSNLPGLVMPIRTLANETFDFQATTAVSVLYGTVKGFIAP